jgi:putative transposase
LQSSVLVEKQQQKKGSPMLTPTEFQQWCRERELPLATCHLIAALRASPPSRRVQGRAHNVSGTYPSRKMGVTIQFESHTVELWAIYLMEHDPDVLEFYDQPEPFKIQYQSTSGRTIGHFHTPDFFVIRKHGAGFEEWKPEAGVQRLAEKWPSRYQRADNGTWRSPPGEAYASPLGLSYRVRSSAELNPTFIQNLMFLEDYLGFTPVVPEQIQARVLSRVRENPGVTLAALIGEGSGVRANDVYALIAQEQLYVDVSTVPLGQHWRTHLYLDQAQAEADTHLSPTVLAQRVGAPFPDQTANLTANTQLVWDGRPWTVINLGETTTTLLPEQGPPVQLPSAFFLQLLEAGAISPLKREELTTSPEVSHRMASASPKDLRTANHRFQVVQAYLQRTADIAPAVTLRTVRRWVKHFHEAEAHFGCGYVGLLPHTAARGNRVPKAPPASRELLDSFIAEHFETPRQAPAASVYRAYQRACAERHLQPLSQYTFYQHIKQRGGATQTEKRKGARAAYQETPWFWELERSTPRHGDRPLAIVHIDHTPLDIELRSSFTDKLLGKPWATMLTDAYSRRLLACYLTFDPPSYRSAMMGLRILVQRFGRFPQAVVVDGGREFHSTYFDMLLARYHCTKKTRPWAKPRFGSVIERLFGTTNTEFVFNLLGNTQAAKQARTLTKAVDPKRQAVWTLGDLYTYLTEWAYQVYDQNVHDTLGLSPHDMYLRGTTQTGEREHRRIPYDEDFLMATRPSTIKQSAKVQPGQGIKVNHLYYWCTDFRSPSVERTQVPVRYDPFDLGTAYAYVKERWVACRSQYYHVFEGHSERELLLATQELRQQAKQTQATASLSAKRLADFLADVQAHETLLLQRLRDVEGRAVLDAIAGGSTSLKGEATAISTSSNLSTHSPLREALEAPLAPVDLTQLSLLEEYR